MPIRTGGEVLHKGQWPERFGEGSEALKPLYRLASGAPLLASQVKTLLVTAADPASRGVPLGDIVMREGALVGGYKWARPRRGRPAWYSPPRRAPKLTL